MRLPVLRLTEPVPTVSLIHVLTTVDEIATRLIASYEPERIILFGSRARGSTEAGDIDLLIVKETAERPIARRIVVERLLADRAVAVDLFVYTPAEMLKLYGMGSPFVEEIVATGKVVYVHQIVEQWLKDAEEDLLSAEILFENKANKGACYHAQQAAEKALKALVIKQGGKPQRVHDLIELRGEVARLGLAVDLDEDDAVFLNSVYKGRYPAEDGLLPHGAPDDDDAKRAVDAARRLVARAKLLAAPQIP